MTSYIQFDQILQKIRELPTGMRDLQDEDFAPEEGLADSAAYFFVTKDTREKKERLKPTQLRKVFHALKAVERKQRGEFKRTDILGILPELAYAYGRELIPREFYDLMKECLSEQKLQNANDFSKLMRFLEAILAYHKFHQAERKSAN